MIADLGVPNFQTNPHIFRYPKDVCMIFVTSPAFCTWEPDWCSIISQVCSPLRLEQSCFPTGRLGFCQKKVHQNISPLPKFIIWRVYTTRPKNGKKSGKRGILGQFLLVCCLFWFLCSCSIFLPYLWCFMRSGFWDIFALNFHLMFWFEWGDNCWVR